MNSYFVVKEVLYKCTVFQDTCYRFPLHLCRTNHCSPEKSCLLRRMNDIEILSNIS
uniref:Uncharacterized protein n=1 Tax=Octopus bimaculoides TaxID=37653 RepID=A0A0L8G1J1_OCTBM